MNKILSEDEILAAELSVSNYFEIIGCRTARAKEVISHTKRCGVNRAATKEARKRLGVLSENVNGEYWWTWPEDTDPKEVNLQKGEEVFARARKRD